MISDSLPAKARGCRAFAVPCCWCGLTAGIHNLQQVVRQTSGFKRWCRLGQKQHKCVSSGVNSLTCEVITLWLGHLSLLPPLELYSVLPAMCRSIYCTVKGMEWSTHGFVFQCTLIFHTVTLEIQIWSHSVHSLRPTRTHGDEGERPHTLYTINLVVKFSVGSVSIAGILLGQISLKASRGEKRSLTHLDTFQSMP